MNRIVHLALKVEDLEKTTEFYQKVFGFQEVETRKTRDHLSRHLTDGAIDFTLIKYDEGTRVRGIPRLGRGALHPPFRDRGRRPREVLEAARRLRLPDDQRPRRHSGQVPRARRHGRRARAEGPLQAARRSTEMRPIPAEERRYRVRRGAGRARRLRRRSKRAVGVSRRRMVQDPASSRCGTACASSCWRCCLWCGAVWKRGSDDGEPVRLAPGRPRARRVGRPHRLHRSAQGARVSAAFGLLTFFVVCDHVSPVASPSPPPRASRAALAFYLVFPLALNVALPVGFLGF